MASTTSPDNLVVPTGTDLISDILTVLANMQASTQAALINRANQSVQKVADDVTRDRLFPAPTQGDRVYRSDLGWEQAYYGTYNATTNPGGYSTPGWYNVSPPQSRGLIAATKNTSSMSFKSTSEQLMQTVTFATQAGHTYEVNGTFFGTASAGAAGTPQVTMRNGSAFFFRIFDTYTVPAGRGFTGSASGYITATQSGSVTMNMYMLVNETTVTTDTGTTMLWVKDLGVMP